MDEHESPKETQGQCRLCWLYTNDWSYYRLWSGGEKGECKWEGEEYTAEQRIQLGLPHANRWKPCNNPSKPLGEHACPCKGCNPSCRGYLPIDIELPGKSAHIYLSDGALGDSISAIYTACGLANVMDREVVFQCRHPGWVTDVRHPNLRIVPQGSLGGNMFQDYDGELASQVNRTCPNRPQWYADQLSNQGFPRFYPARPQKVLKPDRPKDLPENYILLSPFSNAHAREWPHHKWTDLTRQLESHGHHVIGLGDTFQADRLATVFGSTRSRWFWGMEANWVCAAIANASRMIVNDSGLAHVAGLYSVPTLAIMTHLRADFVFGDVAPTVQGVSADPEKWNCLGCGWRDWAGFRSECCNGCPALHDVPVDKVLQLGRL